MNKFLKNYGIYGLGVFLIYCWVEYYTLLRNNSNDEEFNLLLIMTVFIILLITSTTVILPYYLLYSTQFKSFIDKVIKSDKAKKITYYIISIAANYYVISTLFEIYNKYYFGLGAAISSFIFFFLLGYMSKFFSNYLKGEKIWKYINNFIIIFMSGLCIYILSDLYGYFV